MNLLELLRQLAAESQNPAGSPERIAELRDRIAETRAAADAEPIDLTALDADAMTEFEGLRGQPLTAESIAAMEALADICDAVREVAAADEQAAAEAQQRADALAARIAGGDAAGDGDGDQADGGDGGDQAGDGDGGDPAGGDGGTDSAPAGDAPSPAGADQQTPALVASGRRTGGRVPLSALPNQRARKPGSRQGYRWTAAADIHGVPAGSQFRNADAVVQAALTRLGAFGRVAASGTMTAGIAMIDRSGIDPAFTINTPDVPAELIERATDESRLPNGSLVAAGGWCAPSEILYDMLPGSDPGAGIVDLPTITTRRGGVRWPQTPTFASLYAASATTFRQTEAVVIAGATPKPCYEIGCTTFDEVRLDVTGVCVRTPILTERGFPELVRATMAEIMSVHAHKVNAMKIADMATVATAVTMAETDPLTAGYTASLLMAIELQVEWLRYRHRWSPTTTIEAKIPLWARGTIRSDLAARNGQPVDAVTDAQIDAHLRARFVAPQWVYDWQDAFATGQNTSFGGTTPPKKYPDTVTVMLYRAGTYFAAQNDVITVDGLYDSELLAQNMHLALFTEEGFKIGKKDWPAIALTVPVCPSGVTGGQVVVDCTPA